MGTGRPTKYKPEYNDLAYKYCLLGATDKQLADFFEVSESTINEWKINYSEFSESIKNGKEKADMQVAEALFKKATGFINENAVKIFMPAGAENPVYAKYSEYYPPDTAAAFIWLKNRSGWKDKKEVEHSGKVDTTDSELDRRIKELEEKNRVDQS